MWEIKPLNLMCWEGWIVPKRGGMIEDCWGIRVVLYAEVYEGGWSGVLHGWGVGYVCLYALLFLEEVLIRM